MVIKDSSQCIKNDYLPKNFQFKEPSRYRAEELRSLLVFWYHRQQDKRIKVTFQFDCYWDQKLESWLPSLYDKKRSPPTRRANKKKAKIPDESEPNEADEDAPTDISSSDENRPDDDGDEDDEEQEDEEEDDEAGRDENRAEFGRPSQPHSDGENQRRLDEDDEEYDEDDDEEVEKTLADGQSIGGLDNELRYWLDQTPSDGEFGLGDNLVKKSIKRPKKSKRLAADGAGRRTFASSDSDENDDALHRARINLGAKLAASQQMQSGRPQGFTAAMEILTRKGGSNDHGGETLVGVGNDIRTPTDMQAAANKKHKSDVKKTQDRRQEEERKLAAEKKKELDRKKTQQEAQLDNGEEPPLEPAAETPSQTNTNARNRKQKKDGNVQTTKKGQQEPAEDTPPMLAIKPSKKPVGNKAGPSRGAAANVAGVNPQKPKNRPGAGKKSAAAANVAPEDTAYTTRSGLKRVPAEANGDGRRKRLKV